MTKAINKLIKIAAEVGYSYAASIVAKAIKQSFGDEDHDDNI